MTEDKIKTEEKKTAKKKVEKKDLEVKKENKVVEKKMEEKNVESKSEEKKEEKKAEKPKLKKNFAVVRTHNAPISTKHSIAITYFIKKKPILKAIEDLEDVLRMKKAIPMKGEIPHRKGMGPGRYAKNASTYFVKMLRSLAANANANDMENPIITSAIANIGVRPQGRFGRVRKKRTHIEIIAQEKSTIKSKNKNSKNKLKSSNKK